MTFSTLLKHSRPRFWHYLFGPMLVLGAYFLKIGVAQDTWIVYTIILFFTTFLGNLFLYGINDYYDGDTDKYNIKKQGYEQTLEEKSNFLRYICAVQIGFFLFCMLIFYSDGSGSCLGCSYDLRQDIINRIGAIFSPMYRLFRIFQIIVYLGLFYFFSRIYSAPPIRAKGKPFLDGITNVLYIIIPFCVYTGFVSGKDGMMFNSKLFPIIPFAAARLRCIAMHCFSAIPDIEPDSKARITTTAVFLGKQKSLLYCIMLYALAGLLASQVIGILGSVLGLVYCGMVMCGFRYDIFRVYKRFPYINFIVGMLLCFWIYFVL